MIGMPLAMVATFFFFPGERQNRHDTASTVSLSPPIGSQGMLPNPGLKPVEILPIETKTYPPHSAVVTSSPRVQQLDPARYLPWLAMVWFCGVTLLLIRHFGGWLGVVRLRYFGTESPGEKLVQRVAMLSKKMRIRAVVKVLQSPL
ncbi:MAG: hypothetical protein AAF492_25015, partial [Verrucomicrobiota bacterium]